MIRANLLSVAEIKSGDPFTCIKYVVFEGVYRFADASSCNHNEMVSAEERKIPDGIQGAGLFSFCGDFLKWEDGYSRTLDIGERPNDRENIAAFFELPMRMGWGNGNG